MWTFKFTDDPLGCFNKYASVSALVTASAPIDYFILTDNKHNCDLSDADVLGAFAEGGRAGRVTLAHLVAQTVSSLTPQNLEGDANCRTCIVEPLHLMRMSSDLQKNRKFSKRARASKNSSVLPYILERSDIWCDERTLHVNLALVFPQENDSSTKAFTSYTEIIPGDKSFEQRLLSFFQKIEESMPAPSVFLSHIANVALQEKIRNSLMSKDAVAFLANGSIMPRKSGASFAPMNSPPAIPFMAPAESTMTQKITVEIGKLCKYLKNGHLHIDASTNSVSVVGMLVPRGVTLIVGGGYHGKSTMLKTIMTGVYNRVLGDGRELCVTDSSAVTVRAEDGRYVNNTNVSAFISNLPIVGSDTRTFSTAEASGSTSQAANVSEAIEMKAGAILVDEDVSAANFMSRDGRMRALVMDESITPLLYRVNGLYAKHGVSSIVVVGGVGDWLDVPNAVIKLDRYVASDALEKARSISRQFSHNQVQYGGRGVVHRLPWDGDGTPCRRHPIDLETFRGDGQCCLTLMDGGGKILITCPQNEESDENTNACDYDDVAGIIDMTRCEQIMGKWQLFACGICVIRILSLAKAKPDLDLNELVDEIESEMDIKGFRSSLFTDLSMNTERRTIHNSLLENLGLAYRPRRYEILMAVTRMRGLIFGELPTEVDVKDLALKQAAEERKRALAELWANRRKK